MRLVNTILIAVLAAAPVPGYAGNAPAQPSEHIGARLVPLLKDNVVIGLKVYAIESNSRFAQAAFETGDTIVSIDGEPVTTDKGTHALHDKVIRGDADATITVLRKGKQVQLVSKARH